MLQNIKIKFPFFRKTNYTYLDSGATTQAPDQVIKTVSQVLEFRGNPSRSAHKIAVRNEEILDEARENVARFINAKSSEIVFSNNTTDSINLAVDAILEKIGKGDEIILSVAEHHSNLLPYLKLTKKGAKIRVVQMKDGIIDVNGIREVLSAKTKIVAIHHCSNVLGNINPVERIGRLIKKNNSNILFIIDGAQAVAHIPVDVKAIKCDFYAFSSHKMYGPDGVGVLYISKKIHSLLQPVKSGGGTVDDVAITYGKLKDIVSPDYKRSLLTLEGGTPNVSNIAGLSKAINFIRSYGFDEIKSHERTMVDKIITGLENIDDSIVIFGPKNLDNKIGLVSFGISNYSLKELGDYLSKRNINIRYGAHCAFPLAEKCGQETLRISLGIYNDECDIERCLQEIKLFFDKKRGLIKNKNLEIIRNHVYYKNILPVNSAKGILARIKSSIHNVKDSEVIIMAGHFLGIPDKKENKFYPSIKPLLPERLHGLLEEFGMTSFPLFTWEMGASLVSSLKKDGIKAKLLIIANDTTGINELRLSSANKDKKGAAAYRDELMKEFKAPKIPIEYINVLKKNKLSLKDIVKNKDDYFFKESLLRGHFKDFIRKNNEYFDGLVNYSGDEEENINLSINILDNQQIESCRFDTFQSKTGGKFCIIEITQLLAELFGKPKEVNFNYLNKKVLSPVSDTNHKVMVMLTPAMCYDAVSSAAELYIKLMLQERDDGSFKFFNIPLGPDSARFLAGGIETSYLSNKDVLQEINVDHEPNFPELWKLTEYNLLYDINDYVDEMEKMFLKLKINKKSKMLDTCVGPGFFCTELLDLGYNLHTADKSKDMIKPFHRSLKEKGIKHETTVSTWLDLPKHYKKNSFDLLFNRGNTIIYAHNGWNEMVKVDKKATLEALEKTLKVYYNLLKPGGYLYVDKFSDAEIPAKKVAARLNINKSKENKDLIFYVERKPENDVRFAQLLLRDKDGKEKGLPNVAYDLGEDEMELLLKKVGFKNIQKPKLNSERHFVVWVAQK